LSLYQKANNNNAIKFKKRERKDHKVINVTAAAADEKTKKSNLYMYMLKESARTLTL